MEAGVDKIEICLMEPTDIDSILVIDRNISGLERAITYGIDQVIGGQFNLSFIAKVNDKVVGFVLASLMYVPEKTAEVCVIQTIGVDPRYQRKGIATQLIDAVSKTAHDKDIKTIRVMIDRNDKQLQGFFQHLGFQEGRIVNYTKDL
ncbi:MAG: GNAT family N-acetyltransferase [Thermodesulfobacteriota bacterium]|nr:GNAT family N-acetyltransferase [Thermodesulfobacteriota bacterium]